MGTLLNFAIPWLTAIAMAQTINHRALEADDEHHRKSENFDSWRGVVSPVRVSAKDFVVPFVTVAQPSHKMANGRFHK